ncbi:uncharacterized protein METZ01_LOCUS296344 [marine metagenome]|uniref:Uncharacterized protein n=1 Tax=marine metagenome TaxID=408172 RepID=A0A382M479_9ZZZZ
MLIKRTEIWTDNRISWANDWVRGRSNSVSVEQHCNAVSAQLSPQ